MPKKVKKRRNMEATTTEKQRKRSWQKKKSKRRKKKKKREYKQLPQEIKFTRMKSHTDLLISAHTEMVIIQFGE